MRYGEWYGVCDFVVLSVVEVCADYGGANVCLKLDVYGVEVCVNVCVAVCFLRLGVVCCVGSGGCVVIFVLSVMRVNGGVPLWVMCVFRRVDLVFVSVVHQLLF